jgi:transposase
MCAVSSFRNKGTRAISDVFVDELDLGGLGFSRVSDKVNRMDRHHFSKAPYNGRNHFERYFNKIKRFRRAAIHLEKHVTNILAMISWPLYAFAAR